MIALRVCKKGGSYSVAIQHVTAPFDRGADGLDVVAFELYTRERKRIEMRSGEIATMI